MKGLQVFVLLNFGFTSQLTFATTAHLNCHASILWTADESIELSRGFTLDLGSSNAVQISDDYNMHVYSPATGLSTPLELLFYRQANGGVMNYVAQIETDGSEMTVALPLTPGRDLYVTCSKQ